jgi:hypothetical protein
LLFCHNIHVLVGVLASEPSAEGAVLDEPSPAVAVQQFLQMAEDDGLLQFVVLLDAGVQLVHYLCVVQMLQLLLLFACTLLKGLVLS